MYRYKNMNPKGNSIDDCTVRAISVAEDISWDEAYENLSNSAKHVGLMMSSIEAIDYYLDKHYKRMPDHSMTVGEFVDRHPYGTYLITMPGHITVLKENKTGRNCIIDTFDPSNRMMWIAWKVT